MADLLGQRSLFGFGVVLAWLVLFHLLVNIWLLCIFTSLLVVLGSWLGSHAILESNNVVHLERFITMEQVLPSAEDELHLDQEIHNTVKKIIRDFVTSWYSTVSFESGFEVEVQEAMISMAMELKKRAGHVDRKELTQKILNLLGGHLQDYHRAKELTTEKQSNESDLLWKEYSGITVPHLATASETVEVNYVRAVVDLLLHVLVPSPHLETRTGRFVVGELITCNVLLPLFSKLSDPDWLNLLIIDIFDKSCAQRETTATEPPAPPPPPISAESATAPPQRTADAAQAGDDAPPQRAEKEAARDPELSLPELAPYDALDSEEAEFLLAEEYETARPFLRQYIRGSKSNPFYQENDSDLDSPLTDNKPSSTDSLVMMGQEESAFDGQKECAENSNGVDLEDVSLGPMDSSCPKVLVNSEIVEHPNGLPSVRTAEGTSSISGLDMAGRSPVVNQDRELLLGVEQTVMGNPNGLGVISPLQGGSQMATFSFEPLSSPEGPVIIQNLRITGTITAKEHRGTGSHPYTLYTIKYETSVGCENPGISEDGELLQAACESASLLQSVAYHMVNRRYSEFLNLQTRLEEKNELRKLIKGVKGPKKMFPDMPFGNMDSDKIEARKGLLETFLKQLCAIPEIANSEEMQEFLALNTDARIAFVKKPFIVSRIDKIVVNAIVDTLKTAFPRSEPQSPTEDNEAEVDGGKLCTDKKKSRLKLSGKNIPLVNGTDTRPAVLFKLDQTGTVFNGMSLGDLQAFISEQENVSGKAMAVREGSPVSKPCGAALDHTMFKKQSQEHGAAGEMALTEVALNILCLLMKDQWSWLCSENVQRTIRLLFGTLINRWLEVSVANLTCTSYWVVYLQVIQEAVWPGGVLPVTLQPERSQQQKDATKKQALDCLMRVLPDLVSDMLGSDKYKLTWQSALDSFQDSSINRHLVYCLLDLLLDFLVPEIPEEDFQRSLLQAHCKNPEKMLA